MSLQFEDDQNLLVVPAAALADAGMLPTTTGPGLPGYAVANLTVSKSIVREVDVFFGVQNLFGQDYFVGLLPTTIGSPRLVQGGRARAVLEAGKAPCPRMLGNAPGTGPVE